MMANFRIKPYLESGNLSQIVELYNKLLKHLNPEATLEITEELARTLLGEDSGIAENFRIIENQHGENIAFAGVAKWPTFKDSWLAIYGLLPKYLNSELPSKIIEVIIDLGQKINPPELLLQTIGTLSEPFEEKLKSLGLKPIYYSWSMVLDDFELFSPPLVPEGIKIQIKPEIEDYSTCIAVLNDSFQNSFKFNPIKERRWKKLQDTLKINHDVQYIFAYDLDKMVGFCNAYLNFKKRHLGFVIDLGVIQSYQHRKIGSSLLATGIKTLIDKGCKAINLNVDADNQKALELYKKFGFYPKSNVTQKIYQII